MAERYGLNQNPVKDPPFILLYQKIMTNEKEIKLCVAH